MSERVKEAGSAELVMRRIEALAQISEEPGRLTRTFCSPAMRRVNDLCASWMRAAGMETREDALGNLIGHYPAASETLGQRDHGPQEKKLFLLGSHLDTVRDAGKFDGALGVLVALACVEQLQAERKRLPFALEVIGFSDEEGVRYQSTYLGSRALAGTFAVEELNRTDAQGVPMAEALRQFGANPETLDSARLEPSRLLGYAEVHIEQGPVLEKRDRAVGVVTAIAGQTRLRVTFTGQAGHAGTTPMNLRRDALCAAAEFVLAMETLASSRDGLVATVGEIAARPGASNVIPGEVELSLDLRHPDDEMRVKAIRDAQRWAQEIGKERSVSVAWAIAQETDAVVCDRGLSVLMSEAVRAHQPETVLLHSGAGHDAVALARITPVTMLFIRCKGGISHHPAESVSLEDVRVAVAVLRDFLDRLARARAT